MDYRPYDTALILGRYQLFHIGHQSLVDTALTLADRVIILVGSMQESGTERNPLNIATRIDMLKAIYGGNDRVMIYGIPDLTNETDNENTDWGEFIFLNVDRYIHKAPEVMVYGDDRRRGAAGWFKDELLKDTMEIIVPRAKIPISATMLRDMMLRDDRKEWMKWVDPKLHKMYDRLRAELLAVPYYYNEWETKYKVA